jgi:hypothetical protein
MSGKDQGIAETTERVRQLVDGIESAIRAGNDLELASYLAPPALGHALSQTAAMRTTRSTWLPARAGLRWSGSDRAPEGPGRFWLRLRFDDRTEVRSEGANVTAAAITHEVEVELDTTSAPWRLCQADEVFRD